MQAIKIKGDVSPDQMMTAHLPVNIVAGEHEFILIVHDEDRVIQPVDLMQYSGTLDRPEDGLAYQKKARSEWDAD